MARSEVLHVDFLGDGYRISRGGLLTFGRLGDVQLDTNAELPPVAGRIICVGDLWWAKNEMLGVDIEVADRDSRSQILIAPQTQAPVVFERFDLRFSVGPACYELTMSVENPAPRRFDQERLSAMVSLNPEQRLLLTVLAQPWLEERSGAELPTNAEAAARLGWKITKMNRKLDHLCVKFDKLGVPGHGARRSASLSAADSCWSSIAWRPTSSPPTTSSGCVKASAERQRAAMPLESGRWLRCAQLNSGLAARHAWRRSSVLTATSCTVSSASRAARSSRCSGSSVAIRPLRSAVRRAGLERSGGPNLAFRSPTVAPATSVDPLDELALDAPEPARTGSIFGS